MRKITVGETYKLLLDKWGDPANYWPGWCAESKNIDLREEIAIGAILVQRTSWHNAEIALRNLKKEGLLSLSAVSQVDLVKLTQLVRVAGFYATKPRKLANFCRFVIDRYGSWEKFTAESLSLARKKLLSLLGIGPETADTILLYAGDKPTFVVDEYTRRFVRKNNLASDFAYNFLKELFESSLPADFRLYQNLHALIIINEKDGRNSTMGVV